MDYIKDTKIITEQEVENVFLFFVCDRLWPANGGNTEIKE